MSSGGPLTPLGLVLSLQGNTIQQQVGSVFAEKLKIIKAMSGGNLSADMLKGLLGGAGLSSIMQNPLSGIVGTVSQLLTQVTGAQQAVGALTSGGTTGAEGGATPATLTYPQTAAALTALATSARGLLAGTQGLAGTGPAAPYGPLDLVLHATSVGNVGDTFPALSLSAAAAPVMPSVLPIVSSVQSRALAAAADVQRFIPSLSDDAAAAVMSQCASDLVAIMATSTAAIGGLRDALVNIALVQAVAGASVSDMPALNAVLAQIVQPETLATLKVSAEAEYYIEPPVWTNTAPLINNENAAVKQWLGAYARQTGGTTVEVI